MIGFQSCFNRVSIELGFEVWIYAGLVDPSYSRPSGPISPTPGHNLPKSVEHRPNTSPNRASNGQNRPQTCPKPAQTGPKPVTHQKLRLRTEIYVVGADINQAVFFPAAFKAIFCVCLVPPPPGGPEGGSGLSFSFRSQGLGPDPEGNFNFECYFDLEYTCRTFWLIFYFCLFGDLASGP